MGSATSFSFSALSCSGMYFISVVRSKLRSVRASFTLQTLRCKVFLLADALGTVALGRGKRRIGYS